MNRMKGQFNQLTNVILGMLAYGSLAAICYLISGTILSDSNAFPLLALLLSLCIFVLILVKPFTLVFLFFIYLNSVFPREALAFHLMGQIDLLPQDLMFFIMCVLLVSGPKGKRRSLFLGNPISKGLSLFLLVYFICALWSYFYIGNSFFGGWGMVHFMRHFILYILFFFLLDQVNTEGRVRMLFLFLICLAVLGSLIHFVIFFSKGQGLLAQLFPAFLENARPIGTGDYALTNSFLRLNNPTGPLIRSFLVITFSFFLHTRKKYWLLLTLLFTSTVILQFTRMTWISYLLILPLFFPIMARDPSEEPAFIAARRFRWTYLLIWLAIAGLALYVLGGVLKLGTFEMLLDRLMSITSGTQEDSIGGRWTESLWIINQVIASPLFLVFGKGIIFMTADSAYAGLLGATGLLGLSAYLWAVYQYFHYGIRVYYRLHDIFLKPLCLGAMLGLLRVMVNGISGNYFGSARWIPTLCLLFVIPLLCAKLEGLTNTSGPVLPTPEQDHDDPS